MNKPAGKKSQKYDVVRAAALEAIVLIEQGEQSESACHSVMRGRNFRPIDRRFILQLVNGTTKMRRRLDHMIKFYLAKPSAGMPIILSNILRLGFYQLYFTDRIPSAAAVSEAVNLALHFTDRSRANLVNAVMRASLREPNKIKYADKEKEPLRYLAEFYSYPDYFVKYCVQEFGLDAAEQLLAAYNIPPYVTYRVNFLKAKPDEVANVLQKNNIEFSYGRFLPEFIHIEESGLPLDSELLDSGKVLVQDESAGLPVRLMNPRPGNSVLDLTAAPGGKTTYAAIRMRNKGRVTAIDKSHARLKVVVENAQKLGIKIIAPVASDMLDFKSKELFDRVLLDPPCSGWGTAGKHSDLRWSKTNEDIEHLVKIQTHMIDHAATLVKPGGVLVYSTCTIIRQENDQIVEEFLIRHKDFQVESAAEYFGEELVNERGFVKTYPTIPGMDGAFCARLRRSLHN